MLLADHGADVVKVEPPGGDRFRGSAGYDTWLRGRRSAVLDLHDAEDREVFRALARDADVVLETYSPGVTARLGIDADRLCAANPRLVYTSVTAYGSRTSFRDRPGYDALVAARCGTLHEQRGHVGGAMTHMNREEPYLPDLEIPEGMEPGSPRDGPIFTYTPWLSFYAALNATLGSVLRCSPGNAQDAASTSRHRCSERLSRDGVEVDPGRGQRLPPLPHLGVRPPSDEGHVRMLRWALDPAVGPEPGVRTFERRRRDACPATRRRSATGRSRAHRQRISRTSSCSRTTSR